MRTWVASRLIRGIGALTDTVAKVVFSGVGVRPEADVVIAEVKAVALAIRIAPACLVGTVGAVPSAVATETQGQAGTV